MVQHGVALTLEEYKWELGGGGGQCRLDGKVGERSALMVSAPFPLFYCPARKN